MRIAHLAPLVLTCASLCWAQVPALAPTGAAAEKVLPRPAPGAIEQRAERLTIEDAGTRIDELRIGGETRTIDVQPNGGMPAYPIQPTRGERSWKILGF